MRLPVANQEVKIVRAISLRKLRWIGTGLRLNCDHSGEYEQEEEGRLAVFHPHSQSCLKIIIGRAR
jgi:hypothetical protein